MSPLARLLKERIRRQGPISFREFMEAALYHPEHGYYTTVHAFGAEGDFTTSPEVHPVFGGLIGRQAIDLWQALGRPEPLRVLEFGGGAGTLARALIDWVRRESPALAERLDYRIEERSRSLREVQRRRLVGYPVRWERGAEPAHFVIANEVLDAFPIHRVVVRGGALRELWVGLAEDGAFCWVESDDASPELRHYFARLELLPPEGGVAEVNLELDAWVEALAGRIPLGLALVLDYGYTAEELFRRPQGTLLTYYRHTLGSDPLVRVGRQDISAHVDFSTLATAAHRAGLRVLGLVSQRRLLQNLGIGSLAATLTDPGDRRAVAQLVDPAGLGAIKALFVGRALGDYRPAGLVAGWAWELPTSVPRLPPDASPEGFTEMWRDAFGPT